MAARRYTRGLNGYDAADAVDDESGDVCWRDCRRRLSLKGKIRVFITFFFTSMEIDQKLERKNKLTMLSKKLLFRLLLFSGSYMVIEKVKVDNSILDRKLLTLIIAKK